MQRILVVQRGLQSERIMALRPGREAVRRPRSGLPPGKLWLETPGELEPRSPAMAAPVRPVGPEPPPRSWRG